LAQRGLSEMSMAACFAGPSFNLLIGLGCGLLSQKESLLSNDGLSITQLPSVKVGFICLIFNCVITIICGLWNNGMIPKM
jgi:sodium/potassium/calcium exchanger 6